MGPTTHAGKILAFNEGDRTFTILDMETMKPITFSAGRRHHAKNSERGGYGYR